MTRDQISSRLLFLGLCFGLVGAVITAIWPIWVMLGFFVAAFYADFCRW